MMSNDTTDIFSCLPQNRHLVDACSIVSDVKPFSRIGRPKLISPEIMGIYCNFKDSDTETTLHNRIINKISEKLDVTINGDNIEIRDDTYQYVSIPIDRWQEIKELIDSQLE